MSVTAFHIDILNSTTVEVTWRLPYSGVNGIVRGFKIYVDKTNGSESVIDVKGDMVQAYIITDLEQSAKYLFSMLIYTVADGPRGIYLPVIMPDSGKSVTVSSSYPLSIFLVVFCLTSIFQISSHL